MARTDTLNNFLTDVGDSIRSKKGTTDKIPASNFDNEIESIQTTPNLQSKSITITSNGTQNVTADESYDGLSDVSVTTDVSTGGDLPTRGSIINEWNSEGYATKITVIGFDNIPNYAFAAYNKTYQNFITKYLESVNLPNNLLTIGQYAFQNCTNLALTELPSGITSIGQYAFHNCTNLALTELPSGITSIDRYTFYNCTNLALKSLPEGVTSIGNSAFYNCANIIQISMNSVASIIANGITVSPFGKNTSLKTVWIGSAISSSGFSRFSFIDCTNLTKIYIDLPRATVESFTNYQYAFMNDTTKTGIIVCNDDEGFITKEEFDAIDWSTYAEEV